MSKPMTMSKKWLTAFIMLSVAFVLCGGPQLATAQQAPAASEPAQTQPDANAQSQAQSSQAPNQEQQSQSEAAAQQQQQTSRPGMIDPSKGPLTPAPSGNEQPQPAVTPDTLPDAPSATQQQAPENTPPQPNKPRSNQPVGVGTAQQGPTAGGAASKPAGAAIAPAKQKQYRSLLIKIGAIGAAGAALGTVFALSKGTKSTPPGAGR